MEDYEPYADLEVREQLQRELKAIAANRLVQEAEPGPYRIAVLSAVNGKWDDVMKDVRRGRITAKQAKNIIDSLFRSQLITLSLAETFKHRVDQADCSHFIS